jgi:hypothetical protein
MDNETWKLVPHPENRKVIKCIWVFKHKKDEFGKIIRLKARLVACGYAQNHGIDYFETYAPVAKLASIRIVLAIAAWLDADIYQMDVVTAFLANILEEKVFMEQPEGYREMEDLVCLLGKSIYGLKQSARYWNRRLDARLKALGYTPTFVDPCIYVNLDTGVIIAIWVDDILIIGTNIAAINQLKTGLMDEFKMKDMGELQYFLGMQVHRDRAKRTIMIHQEGYNNMILERFGMQQSAPASIPIPQGVKLAKIEDDEESSVDIKRYQSKVGSLMYAMLCTRPDLAFAISQVSQFSSHPSEIHDSAVNRVFKYLRGTTNLAILFDGSDGLVLEGYTDANWGGGTDRKSVGGYVFTLGGGTISWTSKKQPTVALSSTESEYMAITQAAKESIWIQRIIGELGFTGSVKDGNIIYVDNQGAIALAKNPEHHARTKHIDIQYHFIRECVENGNIALQYCPTNEMTADGMTKALPRDRHRYLVGKMGMVNATPSPTSGRISDPHEDRREHGFDDLDEVQGLHEFVDKWE